MELHSEERGQRRSLTRSAEATSHQDRQAPGKEPLARAAVHHLHAAAGGLPPLNMTPKRTMSVAQQLYEGVDISGEGTVGLITYMRTDSLRLSEEALDAAKKLHRERYGADYYPEKTRTFKTKAGAQDAHEAIRPSNVTLAPEIPAKTSRRTSTACTADLGPLSLPARWQTAVYDSVYDRRRLGGLRLPREPLRSLNSRAIPRSMKRRKDEEEGVHVKPLPDLREGEKVLLRKDRQGTAVHPAALPLTQKRHSSARWRKGASAVRRPTRRRSRRSRTASTSSRRASTCVRPFWARSSPSS